MVRMGKESRKHQTVTEKLKESPASLVRECEAKHHQGRWEGRNFEVTFTELRWTGQEVGKNRALLTKDRNASRH